VKSFHNINNGGGNRNILISGSGVAGLTLAYWLHRFGFKVTVVEQVPVLRDGGYKVDVRGSALDVIEKMGILSCVRQKSTGMLGASFVNDAGKRIATMDADLFGGRGHGDIEIMRGDLVRILHDETSQDVEYVFNDSIASISQRENGVDVTFLRGGTRTFDIVVGADGLHSKVRALAFGDEVRFARHFGHYIAIFTTPNHLGLDRWELLYATPGKTVNIYSTQQNKAAVAYLMFSAPFTENVIRDINRQKEFVTRVFDGSRWEVPRLLAQIDDAPDFYFDSISQIHMDQWSVHRTVLLGDAGYCASPASGQGTSLAIVGAYTLAGELALAAGHHETAFAEYEKTMRNFVLLNQSLADGNLKGIVLQSKAHIWFQTRMIRMLPHIPGKDRIVGRIADAIHKAAVAIDLKNYPEAVGK
jgi:2-polyprenyl-6-methoxyphenol hydroxylase-like FAD-dependent oxidoreductase